MAGVKRDLPAAGGDASTDGKRARLSLGGKSSGGGSFEDDLELMAPIATKASAWPRKPLAPVDAQRDDVAFQWIDMDMYDGPPLASNPKAGEPLPGLSAGSGAHAGIIRLYGVTESGNSVLMHVHGVLPYFYAVCPDTFDVSRCGDVRRALDAAVTQRDRGDSGSDVSRVVGVQVIEDRMSIYGYQFDRPLRLWKIYLSMPSFVPKLRAALEGGLTLPGCDYRSFQTYESNVPFLLRFLIDHEIAGCSWLEAPRGSYSVRHASNKQSLCQLEIDIVHTNVVSHAPEGKWGRLAPFRILSFDIECMGRKGHFPEAEKVHSPTSSLFLGRQRSHFYRVYRITGPGDPDRQRGAGAGLAHAHGAQRVRAGHVQTDRGRARDRVRDGGRAARALGAVRARGGPGHPHGLQHRQLRRAVPA